MWDSVKLGDVCDFQGGNQPPKKEFVYEEQKGYVRFIQIRDFKSDKNLTYIPVSKKNRLCNANDIFIGRYGASVGQILQGLEGAYNVALMKTIPNEEVISKGWLFAYLNSPLFQKPLIEVSTRSAQNGFSKDDISTFELPLPPLAEQERIVAKLDAAFAEIDESVNAAKAKETEVQKLKASFLSSSLTGDAVMWKTQKLSDVIEKGETVNPTTNPDTKFSYIDVSSVDRKNFSISKIQTLRGKDAPSRARRLVKTGDVLFATVRPTLQRIAIVPEKLNGEVCSTGYIVLRPKASIICNKFIFYYMLSEKVNTQMEAMQTGASYPAVNDTQVKNLHVSFPSLSEQKLIVARLDRAFSELKNANEAIVKSKANYLALKSAILIKELQSKEAA